MVLAAVWGQGVVVVAERGGGCGGGRRVGRGRGAGRKAWCWPQVDGLQGVWGAVDGSGGGEGVVVRAAVWGWGVVLRIIYERKKT